MKTSELKEVCSVFTGVIKNDKIRPITDLVEIYAKDGIARIGSTDRRTTIVATLEENDNIDNAVISLSSLYKLLKLTTKGTISIKNKGNYVEFVGNGKYKIPIQLDEVGNEINLPLDMPKIGDVISYNIEDWKKVQCRNSVGLFTGDDHDEFKLYYVENDYVVTSDSAVIVKTNNIKLPNGDIQSFIVDQLSCFNNREIKFSNVDNGYRMSIDNFELYMRNKLYYNFPIDIVRPFLINPNQNDLFCGSFVVRTKYIKDAVKRQHIFKNPFSAPSILFDIIDSRIYIKNKDESVIEELEEVHDVNFNCSINILVSTSLFLDVVKNVEESICVYVGKRAICLEDSQGFYIIAAMEV